MYMKVTKEFAELGRGQIMKGFVHCDRMFELQESLKDFDQDFHWQVRSLQLMHD